MHNLVPHFILENFAQGNLRREFPAVALFVDISGFSAVTDTLMQHGQHGAEVLAAVMADRPEIARGIIRALCCRVRDVGRAMTAESGETEPTLGT